MSELRQVEFPDKDVPLRNDVSMLGQLLGDALVEQHGPQLLEQVEHLRKAAILVREGDPEGAKRLETGLQGLDEDQTVRIIKAFSTYLRLANLAENVHRIRRRREYQKRHSGVQQGSLEQVMQTLAESGTEATAMSGLLAHLHIQPVFTAHPTEATRRSLLEKEYSIVHRLVERLNPDRTPEEEQRSLDRIRDAINSAWQTSAVPSAKPSVADELDNVLFYLTEILYRVVPAFHESLEQSLTRHFPDTIEAPPAGQLLGFGSWVGGDMDGNPNVTSQTLLESLATQKQAILRRYQPEVRQLARYLSQTRHHASFSEALETALADYVARFPGLLDSLPVRHHDMPYRCLLKFVSHRLECTQRETDGRYRHAGAFAHDIGLIEHSLASHKGRYAGLFGARRLRLRIATFGFHLATLDARQDALLHRQAMAGLLGQLDWLDLDADRRSARLAELLGTGALAERTRRPDLPRDSEQSIAVFRAIDQARVQYGPEATGLFIISMTQGADDVLTALALAEAGGLVDDGAVPLDVVPLLETVPDLQAGPAILQQLFNIDAYRQHLARRGNRQVVMVGYSDSNKDSGIIAARWSLYAAQQQLVETGRAAGIKVHFFHGRGGTISRGGGNLVKGIEGAPPCSTDGYLRVTEQGEVINQKYGIRPIALRNLELMTGAVIRHHLSDTGQHASEDHLRQMHEMAQQARSAFRGLVFETPEFIRYFRDATPIDVIERLQIGSRPAARRSGEGIGNLRAIPWVFSWGQVRLGLPGVYGAGHALDWAIRTWGLQTVRDMWRDWRFFQGLVNDVEMVLAKSVLDIGQRYADLADASSAFVFDNIRAEFSTATRAILEIKQLDRLLDDQRTLQRNIRLRNPYADPMHILQIDLLRRWRAGDRQDDGLLQSLKATVNGIALAIQNTG